MTRSSCTWAIRPRSLHIRTGYAKIDSINGEAVDSVDGAPRTTPIVLKALSAG